jgi:peptide/nickel transport system permease protein
MIRVLLIRLIRTLLTLLVVVTFTFLLGRLSGNPAELMLGLNATTEEIAAFKEAQGLDEPLSTQFAVYLGNLLQGDLGNTLSIGASRPVVDVIAERLPATLELGLPAFVLSILIGIPLGIISAYKRDSLFDRLTMSFSLIGQSLPSFFVGILLILIFGVQLQWLPTFGRETPAHFILPTVTLMVFPLAFIIRLTRSSMLEVFSESYLRTARAKGLAEPRVIFVHALRNALIPVTTIVGLQVAGILSGSAIVETVFAWPGIGSLSVESINTRNFPIVQAVVLVTAAAFSIANMVVDFFYVLVDPRIQHGS